MLHVKGREMEKLKRKSTTHKDLFYRATGGNFSSGDIRIDVCDFISGMTDRYAFNAYEKIFLPQPWLIV